MGKSDRQTASDDIFSEIGNVNADIPNLFENYQDPNSTNSILGSLDKFTDKAVGNVRKGVASDINRSGSRVGSRLAGRGITGGAILEDTLAGSENRIRKGGKDTIEGLYENRLGQTAGVLERGNDRAFRATSADQSTRFAKLRALFEKLGLKQGAIGGLDDDTFFDDLLAVGNTVGNLAPWNFGGGGGGGASAGR